MAADIDRLQGIWSVIELEMDGNPLPSSMLENARIVVTGDRFASVGMGDGYEGTLELDESKRPKHLTVKFDVGPEKGNTNFCIYELRGNTWKMCIATRGDARPARFVSEPDSGIAVETLRRGNVAPKSSATTTPPPESRNAAVATELEGEWRMVSGIFDGKPLDKSSTEWVKRITHGNKTTVMAGPQTMMQFEFTIDASSSPKGLDYLLTAGSDKGKTQRGIYEFTGDHLTICVSAPGNPRPAQFESKPGSGYTLTVWKK